MIIAHHGKALTDEFLLPALWAMAKTTVRWTEELLKNHLKEAREDRNLQGGIGFTYVSPWARHPRDEISLSLVVRQSDGFQLSNARDADMPLLAREPDSWFRLGGNYKHLDHTNPADMEWFLDKAKIVWPFFEPDFACADTDVKLAKNFGEDPYSVAWPLAYYGGEHVARLGKDKLLAAPAWRVTEDERGGVWLEAAENPFNIEAKNLCELADHLGLRRPK